MSTYYVSGDGVSGTMDVSVAFALSRLLDDKEPSIRGGFFFLLYSEAEMEVFSPVITALHDRGETVRVLLLGEAKREMRSLPAEVVYSFDAFGLDDPDPVDRWAEVELPTLSCLENDIVDSVFVTGASNAVAQQCQERFRERKDVHTVCYWSGSADCVGGEGLRQAYAIAMLVEEVFFPSSAATAAFCVTSRVSRYQVLDTLSAFHCRGREIVIDDARRSLDLDEEDRLVVYMGGNDQDAAYQWDFLPFARIWAAFQFAKPEAKLVIVLDERSREEGRAEREILEGQAGASGLQREVTIVKSSDITFETIVGASRLICLAKGDADNLALMGGRVVHVLEEGPFTTRSIEEGVVTKVHDMAGLVAQYDDEIPLTDMRERAFTAMQRYKGSTTIAIGALMESRDSLVRASRK